MQLVEVIRDRNEHTLSQHVLHSPVQVLPEPISSLLLLFGHAKDSKMQVLREILIYICQKILNNANDLKGEAK